LNELLGCALKGAAQITHKCPCNKVAAADVEPEVWEHILNAGLDICAIYREVPAPSASFDGVVSSREPHGLIITESNPMPCRDNLYLLNERIKSVVVSAIRLEVEL